MGAANKNHIARHSVTPAEAEQAIRIDPLVADIHSHGTEDRVLCFGRTGAGRLLTVLYAARRGRIRIVTVYPTTKRQQKVYFEGK